MNWAHCVPGYLHPSGTMQTAGTTQRWLKETLCAEEGVEAERVGRSPYDLIDDAISRVPAGSHGVLSYLTCSVNGRPGGIHPARGFCRDQPHHSPRRPFARRS